VGTTDENDRFLTAVAEVLARRRASEILGANARNDGEG